MIHRNTTVGNSGHRWQFRSIFMRIIVATIFLTSLYALTPTHHLMAQEPTVSQDDGKAFVDWGQQPGSGISWNEYEVASMLEKTDFLNNVREVRLDGVSVSMSGNMIAMRNLRVASDSTDLDDYLQVDLLFDVETLRLIPIALTTTPDLGIYYQSQDFFSKNVTTTLSMTSPFSGTLASDQMHTITAGADDEFTMFLEAGTVLTMRRIDPSDNYEFQIDGPDGEAYERNLTRAGSRWIAAGRSILQTGIYTFRFVPENDPTVTTEFGFTNNNRTELGDLISGDSISASLNGWGYEYAKYRVTLDAGDLVEITDPSDNDVWLYLLNSNSHSIDSGTGEIFVRAPLAGTYYVFVVNKDFSNGASYFGTITITPDPNRDSYPEFDDIPRQVSNPGELFTLQLTASNTPTNYSATGLPPDLSINGTSGLISGIARVPGTFPIRVYTENEFGSDEYNFLLAIQDSGGGAVHFSYLPIVIKHD